MDIVFFTKILVASLATVGCEEFLKKLFKLSNKIGNAFLMMILATLNYLSAEFLPLWVTGIILTVGCVQLCYQTLVQGFKKIFESVITKITS